MTSKDISTYDIKKEIMYWNIYALKDVIAYGDMIERVEKKQKPNPHDLYIRDFYFTNKLTIDGKFQPESFIYKSIQYMKSFKSLDSSSYLQSINFENNLKKYRFWKTIVSYVSKDKYTYYARQSIEKIIWTYRIPIFAIFASLTYVFMVVAGFTKMKTGKQLATLGAALYAADMFVQRRESSEIFYSIPELKAKYLYKKRKYLINESIVLDGNVFVLDKEIGYETKQLMDQAKVEENQYVKKALLYAAGFHVIDSKQQLI